MNKYSVSLIITEMQKKTTVSCYIASFTMSIIKKIQLIKKVKAMV